MKKKYFLYTIILITISLGIITSWFAFTDPFVSWQNAPVTTVEIEQDSISLGTIKYADNPQIHFKLKNTGQHPLIIKDIVTTCGCTSPRWEKRPVLPGKSSDIQVTFKPNSLGRFTKTIQVLCNTSPEINELKINGYVIE